MNKTLLAFVLLVLGFSSCRKEPKGLTSAEIKYKIDSITKVRIVESDEQAKRDLDHRIKIEVKVKVDSIVNARLNQAKATQPTKPKAMRNAPVGGI